MKKFDDEYLKKFEDEYKIAMYDITPSESFISDTEALMKKLRDEQNDTDKQKESTEIISKKKTSETEAQDISANGRKIRFKPIYSALAVAAAAILCVGGVMRFAGNSKDEDAISVAAPTDMQTDGAVEEAADSTAFDTVSEEAIVKESDETSESTSEDVVEAPAEELITEEETAEEESASVRMSLDGPEEHDVTAYDSSEDDRHFDVLYDNDTVEESYEPAYVSYEPENDTESYEMAYDSDERTETEADDHEDMVFGVSAEEEFEEDTEEVGLVYYSADDNRSSSPVNTVEDVYVPNDICDIEDGTVNLSISSGFDDFDEETNLIRNGCETEIDSDDSAVNDILTAVSEITDERDASYYSVKSDLNNYNYSISVTSDSSDDALLFEIVYNSDTLVINRYENGYVSSQLYDLRDDDSSILDAIMSKV